jgi:hypothetical protein
MSCAPRVLLCALLAATAGLLALERGGENADASEQPIGLWLPWEAGTSWRLTNGPHGSSNDGHGHALDFQPADAAGVSCDSGFSSSYWVVASAGGRVLDRSNGLEIDHGNGLRTGYLHLQEKQMMSGRVDAGDRLGKVSCCPDGGFTSFCWATAPHLHFYTVYNGARQGIVGINLEGWVVQEDGCLARGDETACVMSWLTSGAPSHSPSNADVVLIVDATGDLTTGDPQRARLAAARTYLGVSRPDDRVGIVTYNSTIHGTTHLREVKAKRGMDAALLHRVDRVGASGKADLRVGIRAGCRELVRDGEAEARAAVLISDGMHDYRQFGDPQACFKANGWPLYTVAAGPGGEQSLEQIAADTGGQFVNLNGTAGAGCDLHKLRMAIGGQQPGVCKTDNALHEKTTRITFEVPEGQGEAVFSGNWLRADVPYAVAKRTDIQMKLVSPSGRTIEDGGWTSGGVTHEAGKTYASFAVPSPQAGVWSVRLTGVAAPPEGAPVTVSLTTTVAAPPPPPPAAEPAPEETPAPEESPTETPTETPAEERPASSEDASGSPSVTPTPDASVTPAPTPTPGPTPPPTPEPTPEPTPQPTPEPPPPTPDVTAPP